MTTTIIKNEIIQTSAEKKLIAIKRLDRIKPGRYNLEKINQSFDKLFPAE